jgi:hypothetical protein
MGINGDDARIQLQKMTDVDQVDKQQQEIQRGEAGAVRDRAEAEREKRKSMPTEMQRPDKVLVRQHPHRKRKQQSAQEEGGETGQQEKDEKAKADEDKPEGIGGTLDVRG